MSVLNDKTIYGCRGYPLSTAFIPNYIALIYILEWLFIDSEENIGKGINDSSHFTII